MIRQALGYQYLEAWYHILHLIALLFQVISISLLLTLLSMLYNSTFPFITGNWQSEKSAINRDIKESSRVT